MTILNKELENLSDEQRELFELLLEKEGVDFSQLPITRRTCKGSAPLSYAQHGLWLAVKTTPSNPFNHSLGFRIHGMLNSTALERGLNEILNRHEILRTVCSIADGELVQIVNVPCTLTIPIVDLQNLRNEQKEIEALRLAVEEAQQHLDLERGPLLRTKLVRLDEREYIFILTTHSFITDGFSQGILLRELGKLYDIFLQGNPSPFHELPIQFADFAVWQRRIINSEVFNNQLAYWKQQLKGSPAKLKWPIDRASTSIQSYYGKTKSFTLPVELSESLRALARKEGVTLFMLLLASIKIFLYRLTKQEDIVVSTMVSNRNQSELETLIGYFANNLLLRSKVSPDITFCQLLKKVSETTIGAFANQDYPFERVFEEIALDQEAIQVPMLQVMFVLHDHSIEEDLKISELTIENYPIEKGTAIFDLYFRMTDVNDKLTGSVEYKTELFDSATIDQILRHFQSLLQSIVLNPLQRVSELKFLNDLERNQLIGKWNENQTKLMKGFTIELDDIESTLIESEAVSQVAVMIREDRPGDRKLVVYYVPEEGAYSTATELRKYLRAYLPEYMIPQHFVKIDVLPLTPNGKVNHKALPAPFKEVTNKDQYVPPRTEFEKELAVIWQEILGVNQVSVYDSFFDIGGSSLMVYSVLARAKKRLGVKLKPWSLVSDNLGQIASNYEAQYHSSRFGDGTEVK